MTAPAYTLHHGDALTVLQTLPSESVHVCVTSPPYYGLRDYGTATWEGGDPDCDHVGTQVRTVSGGPGKQYTNVGSNRVYSGNCKCGARRVDQQLGLEDTPDAYVARLVEVFREVRRVLHKTGTLWLNLGDSYNGSGGYYPDSPSNLAGSLSSRQDAGSGAKRQGATRVAGLKAKDLIGIPWMVAFALQADGWYLRSEIIWHKKAPMPESVTDRPTKAHEQVFLLAKSASYYYDAEAIREPASQSTIIRSQQGNGFAVNAHNSKIRQADNSMAMGGTKVREGRDFKADVENGRNKRSVWTLGPEQFSGWTPTSRLARVEADDVSDDTRCKVSPDCPVHAGLFDWAATDSYDVRVGDLLSRMSRKRTRRAPKPAFGSAPTDQHRGAAKSGQSSDLPHLPYSLFAIDHSNGSHKTGPDPVTNQPCNVSDETPDRIDDRQDAPDYGTPSQNKSLNNTAVGDSASNEVSEILDRNVHSYELPDSLGASIIPPECTCEFYHEITENTSHFATMPTKLVEPCILAGSSAYGCCSQCGAPWERVTERTKYEPEEVPVGVRRVDDSRGDKTRKLNGKAYNESVRVTGERWQPTCSCNADVIPCTALDPFGGSGTTLAVALKHGRSAIGIDLNAEYIDLAHDRIGRTQPLLLDIT